MADADCSGPDGRASGLRADAARNRAKVIAAARQRLLDGESSLSMNTISRQAGVGVGTVYRHFPTRQDLLEAVAHDGLAAIVDAARVAVAATDPVAGFEQFMWTALNSLLDDPALVELVSSPAVQLINTVPLGQELERLTQVVVDRAAAVGHLRGDIVGDDLRRLVVGVHSAVTSGCADQGCARRFLTVVLNGLRPHVAPAGPLSPCQGVPPGG